MVAYNFPHEMAEPIILGKKAGCLKPHGKRDHVTVGGTVTAFVGNVPPDWSRSPNCHRLLDAPCVRSVPVMINDDGMVLEGRWMTNPEFLRLLAETEGAPDFVTLQRRLRNTGNWPWQGQYIRWNADQATFRAEWPLVARPPPEPPPQGESHA
jgi:hypothetical protein